MARFRHLPLLGASTFLLALLITVANADNPVSYDDLINRQVQIQSLIAQADHLMLVDNNPAAAVEVLEKNLSLIDGNKIYLVRLRDAYKKHIINLFLAHQNDQAQKYLTRLRILDPQSADQLTKNPGASLTKAGSAMPAPVAVPAVAPQAAGKLPASATATGGKGVAVGKLLEDDTTDPFALEHAYAKSEMAAAAIQKVGGKASPADALLSDAFAKFDQQKYADALVRFEQAYQADKKIAQVQSTADRWAYCRFHIVADQLNQKQPGKSLTDLEGEVNAGLSLSPNAEVANQGQKLLQQIAQRQSGSTAAAAVKHLGKDARGWQVTETANFRVFHNQDPKYAEQVAQVAEQTRVAMTAKWFGSSAKAWRDRCDIYLHPTGKEYSQKTGVPPQQPGHSRIETDNSTGEVVCRQIELRCDNPDLLTAVLPHETTHVILAGQFGTRQVPRWVDEGVAVLTEPKAKVDLHLKNLPQHQQRQELFAVGDLMEMKDYPPASRVGAFYAQSVSLVAYLSAERGPQVFTRFINDGLATGFENALRKHYNIQNYAELQTRWAKQTLYGNSYAQK